MTSGTPASNYFRPHKELLNYCGISQDTHNTAQSHALNCISLGFRGESRELGLYLEVGWEGGGDEGSQNQGRVVRSPCEAISKTEGETWWQQPNAEQSLASTGAGSRLNWFPAASTAHS